MPQIAEDAGGGMLAARPGVPFATLFRGARGSTPGALCDLGRHTSVTKKERPGASRGAYKHNGCSAPVGSGYVLAG